MPIKYVMLCYVLEFFALQTQECPQLLITILAV